jgi:predicted transcriptional regulator
MSKKELTDEEIKADIMNKLLRKNCWGAKYLPLDTLINWFSKAAKRDGKRVKTIIRALVNEGYLLLHKGGKTVSLNPAMSREIIEYVEKVVERR